jgi:RNA polymerase sigma factor (TIGR02999 family)
VASASYGISNLLKAWSAGDERALEQLTPLVYAELHRAAHRYMAGERTEHTLQTTALINELYLRLVDFQKLDWQNRAHFFGVCAQLMRRILVDFARERCSQKRGGEIARLSLDEELVVSKEPQADLVALDDALKALAAIDERKSRVVELRFFGGLDVRETAEVLRVSAETVMRDWKLAKAWLFRELSQESRNGF